MIHEVFFGKKGRCGENLGPEYGETGREIEESGEMEEGREMRYERR